MKHLTILSLSFLIALGSIDFALSQTPDCKQGNARNTAYMQRNNDKRCEGITTPNVVRSDFGLRSFAIGQLTDASNLSLTIPKLASQPQPQLKIQSTQRYYQLDPLALTDAGKQWQFQWPNTILHKENISLGDLRSLAETGPDRIIVPIRFSPSPNYDLHIYTGNRTKTLTLKILDSKNNPIYSTTKTDQPGTEVALSWNGRTSRNRLAKAGRYTLRIEAEVERPNAPSERRQSTRQFEHNPAWLK